MKVQTVARNIFLLTFPTRRELCSTLLRFEEYYESPRFKGRIFTFDEYRKWYVKNSPKGKKTGRFTYYSDWSGFNIPSYALKPFYEGKFDPLSREEKLVLERFRKYGTFYIIAISANPNKDILRHEIAHGLFYTNAKYKREILKAIGKIIPKTRKQINDYFKKYNGYHQDVWTDETHAYVMTELSHLKRHDVDIRGLKSLHDELNSVFEKYYNK